MSESEAEKKFWRAWNKVTVIAGVLIVFYALNDIFG